MAEDIEAKLNAENSKKEEIEFPLSVLNAQNVLLDYISESKNKPKYGAQEWWRAPNDTAFLQYGHKLAEIQIENSSSIKASVRIENLDEVVMLDKATLPLIDSPKIPGQTRKLYEAIAEVLQKISDTARKTVYQQFGTANPNLIKFIELNAEQLGFTILGRNGSVVSAIKVYSPSTSEVA